MTSYRLSRVGVVVLPLKQAENRMLFKRDVCVYFPVIRGNS